MTNHQDFMNVSFKEYKRRCVTYRIKKDSLYEQLQRWFSHEIICAPITLIDEFGKELKVLVHHFSMSKHIEFHPLVNSADKIICCYPAYTPDYVKDKAFFNDHLLRCGVKLIGDEKEFLEISTLNEGKLLISYVSA